MSNVIASPTKEYHSYTPTNEVWGVYRNHPVCLSVRLSVCLSRVNLALAITFELKEIKLSYYTCVFLVTSPFSQYQKCWPYDLDLDFLTFFWKNLNLRFNIPKEMGISCVYSLWQDLSVGTKTFDPVTLTLTFDLLLKKLILAFTFVPKEIGLSYYSWIFIVARPFCPYQHFLFCDLDLNFDLVLKKKVNLGIYFWISEREGFHITHGYYLLQDLSVHTKIFYLMTLTNNFDLLLKKKLNLGINVWT